MAARVAEAMKMILREECFAGFLGNKLKVVNASKSKVCIEMSVEEEHQNESGMLHSGVSATLIDAVSTIALHSSEKNANLGVSIDMNITYLESAPVGSSILIESEALKVGRRFAYLTVNIKDKTTGNLLVQGRHTKYMG